MQETGSTSADVITGIRGMRWSLSFGDVEKVFKTGWSADGNYIAAVASGKIEAWRASDNHSAVDGRDEFKDSQAMEWHPDKPLLAIGSNAGKIILWNALTGTSRTVSDLENRPVDVAWSPDGRMIAILEDSMVSIIDSEEGTILRRAAVSGGRLGIRWSLDGSTLVAYGRTSPYIIFLAVNDLQMIWHQDISARSIYDAALSPSGNLIAFASSDGSVRILDLKKRVTIAVLEGNKAVLGVCFTSDSRFLISISNNQSDPASDSFFIWRCSNWILVGAAARPSDNAIRGLAIHPSRPLLALKNPHLERIDCYELDYTLLGVTSADPASRQYGNAKVVLLGDSGVGKSGLGLVLSGRPYEPTDSTHGRHVWTLEAEESEIPGGGVQTREVLLWDLAGQSGYRIIHQLHLNEVAVALIVFDSRSETDPFSGVKYWARALAQARKLEGASAVPMRVYLVAARTDRGGIGVSAERIQVMVSDLGLDGFFETSAKEGWQVADVIQAIRDGIDWNALPMISSSVLFDSIKQFLIEEKQQGRLLCTSDDLFHGFRRTRSREADEGGLRTSFETCIGRVESRGLIRRLHFGGLVLLQPELLDAYASGMVQAARAEPDGLGFIAEEDALAGRFRLAESERITDGAQEKLLLIATVEELLRHEIALKEVTDQGVDLVFPSQFTRERPDAPDIPGKEVTFAFEGPLHNIYAALAVRLSHSALFERQAMWQNAASYTATVGGMCGIHLRELEEGRGELVLFYDEQASRAVRSQFETYVADHLRLRAIPGTLLRRVIRACPNCGYVLPEDLVRRRLDRGAAVVRCPDCEEAEIVLTEEQPTPTDMAVAEMNRSADERRDEGAAALRLKGKIETNDYDVFLCYNSSDRTHVVAIGEQLRKRGILPWLDIWAIPPGARWQKELQKQLKSVKSAAVFIGPRGSGPWQDLEVESLLGQIAKRNRPLIPVILEGRAGKPRPPTLLDSWHVVDMRQPDPDPFEQLVWGITGENPARF
jgi:WD40 repeat protein